MQQLDKLVAETIYILLLLGNNPWCHDSLLEEQVQHLWATTWRRETFCERFSRQHWNLWLHLLPGYLSEFEFAATALIYSLFDVKAGYLLWRKVCLVSTTLGILQMGFFRWLQKFSRAHWLIFIVNKRTYSWIFNSCDASANKGGQFDNLLPSKNKLTTVFKRLSCYCLWISS